jgi:hypothetical protein
MASSGFFIGFSLELSSFDDKPSANAAMQLKTISAI